MVAAVMCVQHILYVMRVLESMELLVEKLMAIEIDKYRRKSKVHTYTNVFLERLERRGDLGNTLEEG